MGFYSNPPDVRKEIVNKIRQTLLTALISGSDEPIKRVFSDEDTYIRKAGYESIGKIFKEDDAYTLTICKVLTRLFNHSNEKIRQTVINAAGEIAKSKFELVRDLFEKGLFDKHHRVRNAVIGSIKKSGQVNPEPVLLFARRFLHHPDKEIRREICHGIELRGRTHPQDILPLLEELQFDKAARVRNTLVHVIGQIAYKKGCLETVISTIRHWKNQELVKDAIDEIIDVHDRYKDFSAYTQAQAIEYINKTRS